MLEVDKMYAFFKGKVDNILNDRIIIDVNKVLLNSKVILLSLK